MNYNASTKSYSFSEKADPKDRVEVEVGDAMDAATFHPQVKIKRWDNEVNTSIRLKHDTIPGNITYTDDGTKITWSKKQGQNEWKAVFYHRDDVQDGGFEFEIHLPAKPAVNHLDFTVNTKELDWFYQPELTEEEVASGLYRPDNIVGSYAVYHKTKGGVNASSGAEYKTGKAFHVYRPHVVDSVGNEIWGSLSVNEHSGTMRVSVDPAWLNNATYPVIIDPTFGYTTAGGTTGSITCATAGTIIGSKATGSVGNGMSISVYGSTPNAAKTIGAYLYDASRNKVTNGQTETAAAPTSAGWTTMNFSATPSITAQTYHLVVWTSVSCPITQSGFTVNYDSVGSSVSGLSVGGTSSSYTWPATLDDEFTLNRTYSIYATYASTDPLSVGTDSDSALMARGVRIV